MDNEKKLHIKCPNCQFDLSELFNTPQKIIANFEIANELPLGTLKSRTRNSYVIKIKKEVIKVLRGAGYSYNTIGEALNRNHETIMYLDKK